MSFRLYNVHTGKPYGPARLAPYSVDGKPGALPAELVEVETVEEEFPAAPAGHVVNRVEFLDLGKKQLRVSWELVPVPEEPAEKSETENLADRVTALELEIQKLKDGAK